MYVQFTSCVHWDDCVWSFLISLVTINNIFTANIYLFRVKNRNTRKRCKMCSKLTIKTPVPEWCHWCRSGFLIVNFEHISLLFLCFCCWLWTSKCYLEKNFLATIYKICRGVFIILLNIYDGVLHIASDTYTYSILIHLTQLILIVY